MVLISNFVRGGYNRSANAPASIMSLDTTPLLEQLNELRTFVYKYVRKDGDHPPPPYVPPQPSAPETDKQLFLENILQEPPQPKATSRLYPDISVRNRFKLIKETINRPGGEVLADIIEEYLDGPKSGEGIAQGAMANPLDEIAKFIRELQRFARSLSQ